MNTARSPVIAATIAAVGLGLAACSNRGVIVTSEPQHPGPSTAVTLDIPPGHLPPPGDCRVWVPGDPPGQQEPSGSCPELATRVPSGSWLVYNPGSEGKPGKSQRNAGRGKAKGKGKARGKGKRGPARVQIRVTVYGSSSPRVVRWFDRSSGKLVRQEEADGS